MSPFKRNQFGGDGGGAIQKDKTFLFLSYEALRQRQSVPLSSATLSLAQRAQAASSSDSIVQSLLPLIPLPNSGSNQFAGSDVAPVNIQQGTANFSYSFSDSNRFNAYYAIQRDQRNEPPSTDGNSFPGGGDQCNGQRQLLTLNDVWTITPTLVNEARLGFNRIHITFVGDNTSSAAAYGINSGVTSAIGLPQITVSGAFTFGGINGFPQGRGDDVGVLSDTFSWVRGTHTIKAGGEFRRQNTDSFSYTPGTFGFATINAFLADLANGFTANTSNRSSRVYGSSLGAFVTETAQSGNPINFHLSNTSFVRFALLRPDVVGPVITGFTPATNGSATTVTYVQDPSAFINQGTTRGTTLGFGNLGRNVIIGPGFFDTDVALVKNTKITERLNWQLRVDAFDVFNRVNFTQPVSTIGSSTLGLITGGTRFPAGDGATSRQLQLAMKLIF